MGSSVSGCQGQASRSLAGQSWPESGLFGYSFHIEEHFLSEATSLGSISKGSLVHLGQKVAVRANGFATPAIKQ